MILSGEEVKRLKIVKPCCERTRVNKRLYDNSIVELSYGLGPNGYDVRVEFDSRGHKDSELIWPGRFLLASTIEHITMPIDVMARIHDKSTWIRLGLEVHNSTIDAGWSGYLTIELYNKGFHPIYLSRGDPIANLVFEEVKGTIIPYEGKYQNQKRGPQEAL